MESRTGEALDLMLRADGDGVLTPLVLAMAKVERFQRVGEGARGVLLQTYVIWTSFEEGPLIFLSFATWRGFSQVKIAVRNKNFGN